MQPQYIAYEDANLKIGFLFKREDAQTHLIKACFSNKTQMLLTMLNL